MHNSLHRMCRYVQSAAPATFGTSQNGTHCPELDEILQHGGGDEQTVHQRVGQEEDEKLVIGEPHTVVHPVDAQLHL